MAGVDTSFSAKAPGIVKNAAEPNVALRRNSRRKQDGQLMFWIRVTVIGE
jgi:hypothetical protein